MSLVQSVFNQIGREIGRDIYRGSTSLKQIVNPESPEITLLNEIRSFELAGYDKVTMRKLANFVEKTNDISSHNFIFDDIFIELDSKIDFAKENLDKSYLEELEKLDKMNNFRYLSLLEAHKLWLTRTIEDKRDKVSKLKDVNSFFPFLIKDSFFIISLIICFYFLYQSNFTLTGTFSDFNNDNHSDNLSGLWFLLSMILLLLPSITLRLSKKDKINKSNESERQTLSDLEKYYSNLK
jgi:hypothetical protein